MIGVHIDPTGGGERWAESAKEVAVAVLEHHLSHVRRWMQGQHAWPTEWAKVADQSQYRLWVTPQELADLVRTYSELIGRYRERIADPSLRLDEAGPVEV